MKNKIVLSVMLLGIMTGVSAQMFTQLDTLRGSITPEREWWDVSYYDLNLKIDPEAEYISGFNRIRYKVLKEADVIQIDLQRPLQIDEVTQDNQPLEFTSIGPAHFIKLKKKQRKGDYNELKVVYSGEPRKAVRAPWDGGFSWSRDDNNLPFAATSCQGLGASVWWPNKDHMYDEVDSMRISVDVPKNLMNVSNGRLIDTSEGDTTKNFTWFVSNPINNYCVNVNIGDYVHFGEQFKGEKGALDVDYYVLRDNLDKAKEQFKQASMMLEAFEHWFGPYPFYEDSFKLVEVPYLGMEHQSSVTYGNKYQNGYLGRDLSGSGWGLKFDFIIIHEGGHEWFANNITYKDIADMWIHEAFTAYSENLYLDYHYGTKASAEYVIGTRKNIRNDRPIIGPYNVNKSGSGDMYYKGANMLHTLRQLLEDDTLWRSILRGLNEEFYHQTVTTEQIENYISKKTKKDLSAFFNQYLRTAMIPKLEYKQDGDTLRFRYVDIVEDFDMPIRLFVDGKEQWIYPNSEWKTEKLKGTTLVFDENFYVETEQI
ncbi:M1 family metallopeptidase [Flagellimonas flava]|uniref:M1 family metallopeptidase n=1 Tax=Flagellimonas flava TaxID=570519 RepID=UPI003D65A157